MDRLNMSLDDIIKMNDSEQGSVHQEESVIDQVAEKKENSGQFNKWYRSKRSFSGYRANPYVQPRQWHQQHFHDQNSYRFRGHNRNHRRNFYGPHRNNSGLTEAALYDFNRTNHYRNNLRRAGSFSDLNFNNGPYMRNGFIRSGSVTSLHSGHSVGSTRSSRSYYSNYSNRSNSHHSGRSGNGFRPHYFRRHFQRKFRFFLNWMIQKEIKKLQLEGQRIRRNSPMSLKGHDVEKLVVIPFSTSMKMCDRITTNNA